MHGLPPVNVSNSCPHISQGNTVIMNDTAIMYANSQDDHFSGVSSSENYDEGFSGSQTLPDECDSDSDISNVEDKLIENYSENEEKEIFDENGKWNSSFLRQIINVMDKHKISHTAYHELKMTLPAGFNPPINQIKVENELCHKRFHSRNTSL